MENDEKLKLRNQLCFPVYLAAKEIIAKYGEMLEPLQLTYTQYLVMLVLWQEEVVDMKKLGEMLFLDSSTLTPVINWLVDKEYVRLLHWKKQVCLLKIWNRLKLQW